MPTTTSLTVPNSGKGLRLGDAGWVTRLSLQALIRLIRARLVFARLHARDIPARNKAAARAGVAIGRDELLADRIGFIITRLSKRLPWRSDCLIQAIAAQDWLLRAGMASEIRIGVELPEEGPFGAHAWLVVGEKVITGGDISRYTTLIGRSPPGPDCGDEGA